MKFKAILAATVFAASVIAVPASATTITFDDLDLTSGVAGPLPSNYAGFAWNNIYGLDAVTFKLNGTSGYDKGLVSGRNVAFVLDSSTGTMSSATPFTFNGGYFTAAWNNNMTLTIAGLVNGVQTFTDSFIIDQTGPVQKTYNWSGLTSVTFRSSGGVNAGLFGGGTHVAIDNLSINATPAVPEPATWAMMILGMGAVGFAMRRSRKSKVNTTVSFA